MIRAYLLFVLIVMTLVVVSARWLPWWGAVLVIPSTVLFFIWLTVWLIKRWFASVMLQGMQEAAAPLRGASVQIHGCHSVPEPDGIRRQREEDELAELDERRADEEGEGVDDGSDTDPSRAEADNPLEPERWVALEFTLTPDPAIAEAALTDVLDAEDGEPLDETPRWEPNTFTLVDRETPSFDPKREGLLAMAGRVHALVVRSERLTADGSEVVLDSDDWAAMREEDLEQAELPEDAIGVDEGATRVRLTFGIPKDLHGGVKLRYLLHDLAECTLPGR